MAEPARRPELIVAAIVRFARDLDAGIPLPGQNRSTFGFASRCWADGDDEAATAATSTMATRNGLPVISV